MEYQICCLLKTALFGKIRDRNKAKEALALSIAQIPEITAYIDEGLRPYIEKALEKTEADVKKNLEKFPQSYRLDLNNLDCQNKSDANKIKKSFVRWTKMILKADCIDERRKRRKILTISLDAPVGDETGSKDLHEIIPTPTLSGLDRLFKEERKEIAIRIKNYIDIDPEGTLRNSHPRSRPQCNCQILMQMHLLQEPPATPKQIAQQVETPQPTVYERLRMCKELLGEIVREMEQQSDRESIKP